jgi:Amt family ammonium transporter
MNTANTVFLIVSAILVFFMTPGLAFFYGGLVSKKNVVNTMLSVFVICGLAIVLFVAFGYEMCFNGNIGGVVGHVRHFFLSGVDLNKIVLKDLGINSATYLVFEMMFAIITPALFVGATVGRMHFKFLLWFVVIWSILIYYPPGTHGLGCRRLNGQVGHPGLRRRDRRAHQRRDYRLGFVHLPWAALQP